MNTATVIDEALALPPAERSYLAERLIASLDGECELPQEWRTEIEQRIGRRERGETRTFSRDEVSRDVESFLTK